MAKDGPQRLRAVAVIGLQTFVVGARGSPELGLERIAAVSASVPACHLPDTSADKLESCKNGADPTGESGALGGLFFSHLIPVPRSRGRSEKPKNKPQPRQGALSGGSSLFYAASAEPWSTPTSRSSASWAILALSFD